jgi:hypothetical protein
VERDDAEFRASPRCTIEELPLLDMQKGQEPVEPRPSGHLYAAIGR